MRYLVENIISTLYNMAMPYKNKEDERAFFRRRYAANLKFVQEYKLEKGCADCGYKAHHAALEFDHIKPAKRGRVSAQLGKSMRCIQEEIELCEVVCANCHSLRTYRRGWQGKSQHDYRK